MSKEDHFPKKRMTNPTPDSPEWADIVDRLGQPAPSGDSDGAEPTEPVNLTPEQLDDLELDRQLRMLAKISSSEDSFVSKVMSQTQFGSSPVSQKRARLPVVGPTLVGGASEEAAESPESIAQSSDTISDSADVAAQSSFASSADQETGAPPVTLPTEQTARRRPVALLVLLASVLFIGFFLGSMWWSDSASKVADTENPKAGAGDFVRLKGISDSQEQSLEDAPDPSKEMDGDANRFSDGEALADQKMERGGLVDPLAASSEKVDLEDWNDAPQPAGGTDSNPTLADIERKSVPAASSTEDGMQGLEDDSNLTDQSVAEYSSDGQSGRSKIDWNLAFRFNRRSVGSVTLNGQPVKAVVLKDNAAFLLRKIAGEFQRRVQYLENRLDAKVRGSIAVDDSNYSFNSLAQLNEAVDKVDQQISELDVRPFRFDELMKVRAGYRERLFAQSNNRFGLINLTSENLRLYTEDEVFSICSVLSDSEDILRGLAKERLIWEKENEVLPTKSKLVNRIQPKEFFHFANNGALNPPDPRFSDQSITGIQNLGALELQRMLQGAPSVQLFRDANEFQQARDFVFSNGSPEMKLQLQIDKIDRMLNKKGIPITEAARDVLNARKAKAEREFIITMARQGVGLKDHAPMEPLRAVLAERTDLQGLPLVMGDESRGDGTETRELKRVSSSLGRAITMFNGSIGSRDSTQNDALRNLSVKNMVSSCLQDRGGEQSSRKLKTIDQILQIDHPRLRQEMIGTLRKSGSVDALKLLVDKALFDLEPDVRIAATAALADLEPDDIRGLLLEGFKYPWHVVAEHSAEALVRLDDQDAVPQLIEMLDLPHPHSPFEDNGTLVQRELVGINHLRNCLLCHAPSTNSFDSVRALVPQAGRPVNNLAGRVGDVSLAIRADVTYLKEDFSVVQPVKDAGPWPSDQRIDYVVRKKKLTPAEAEKVARQISQSPNRYLNAIIFALRELTGETPRDNSSKNWRRITAGRDQGGE